MGLIRGEWHFTDTTPPSLEEIAEALAARTGLEVHWDRDNDPFWLEVPLLRERLLEPERHPDRILIHSFIPAHPYVWIQLHKVMAGFGATALNDPYYWAPDPATVNLDLPWAELNKWQRFALRGRSIAGWRPFDFLLRTGGGRR